jgi:hypothetical protein
VKVPPGKTRNRPTELGREAGFHLARLCDDAERSREPLHPRCRTCAFRAGSLPNRCEATVLDAHKCLIEDIPFMCHERKGKPCSGWVTMRMKGSDLKTPWPFSYGEDQHFSSGR